MDNGRTAIKIGVFAGVVSALLPSIPTVYKMEYYKERWFQVYVVVSVIALIVLFAVL